MTLAEASGPRLSKQIRAFMEWASSPMATEDLAASLAADEEATAFDLAEMQRGGEVVLIRDRIYDRDAAAAACRLGCGTCDLPDPFDDD